MKNRHLFTIGFTIGLFLLGTAFAPAANSAIEVDGKYYDSNSKVMSPEEVSHHRQLTVQSCNAEWQRYVQALRADGSSGTPRSLLDKFMNEEIVKYYDRALPEKTRWKDGRYLGGLSSGVAKQKKELAARAAKVKAKPNDLYEKARLKIQEYILCKVLAAEKLEKQFKSGSSARVSPRAANPGSPSGAPSAGTFGKENRYEGESLNGKMHGQGVYTWANGDRFEGEFRDGKLYLGKVIKPNGDVVSVYVNGVLTVFPDRNKARASNAQGAGGERRRSGATSAQGPDGRSSARAGKSVRTKRGNVPEAYASKCLSLNKKSKAYGGFINSCDFAVEFVWCNVQPPKGSWSEEFDCNKNKTGSWQVGAKNVSAQHTKGKNVHWFACKYGETLGKAIGISPAGVVWNAKTRHLEGRCAEWGAK